MTTHAEFFPMTKLQVPNPHFKAINPPHRLLLGPGPQDAHPRVHAALSLPQVGHMDPGFLEIMEEAKALLKYAWQTENKFTIPISGTGSAAWEAAIANLTEPGDVHLIFANGFFGQRALDMHSRYGAVIRKCVKADGEVFTLAEIEAGIIEHKPDLIWLCHAETSTGTLQPMEGVGDLCRKYDCLVMLDTVTSICGSPIYIDAWKIDAAYGGSQKCMGCPPGVSCLTLNDRALAKLDARKNPVANWYLDMTMIRKYIFEPEPGVPRVYHHTAPISMIYAIREALQIVSEEGLEQSWERHKKTAERLYKELELMGLEFIVKDKSIRTPCLTTVKLPADVSAAVVLKYMRDELFIEVGGGLGYLSGKIVRIGLMGYNSRADNVILVIQALKEAIAFARSNAL